jgi:hypothetical protein
VAEYRSKGYAFLESVFNDGGSSSDTGGIGILDRVTGLQKLKEETEAKLKKAAEDAKAKRAGAAQATATAGAGRAAGGGDDDDYADLLEEWVLGNE